MGVNERSILGSKRVGRSMDAFEFLAARGFTLLAIGTLENRERPLDGVDDTL